VAVLSVSGFIPDQDANRLVGAVGWVCARSSGPLVLDLTGLRGWSPMGEAALGAAARGWSGDGRDIVVCLAPTSPLALTDAELAGARRYPDLRSAVAALRAPDPDG